MFEIKETRVGSDPDSLNTLSAPRGGVKGGLQAGICAPLLGTGATPDRVSGGHVSARTGADALTPPSARAAGHPDTPLSTQVKSTSRASRRHYPGRQAP